MQLRIVANDIAQSIAEPRAAARVRGLFG
jgi:hypothetical protein